jgi:GNAT acetyltransferase-like protein
VAYSYRIFNSIEQVDLTEWQRVRSACDGSIVMDPRFIAAVEISTKKVYKFWYIVIYDHEGVAVACTSACAITVDLLDFADPGLARIIRHVPLLFSRLQHLTIIVCGLPIGGHHTLAIAQRSASPQILPMLDSVLCELATTAKADAIIYKEFEKQDFDWTNPLLTLGYCRIATPPTHQFRPSFDDFAQYCAALRKHYLNQINRSRLKLTYPGVDLMVLTDSKEIVRAYTREVHALYHQMEERAAIRLVVLPIEFLHEAALRLSEHLELIAIRKDARIIAFACCLHAQSTYYTMYAGLDYDLNDEYDLYFNLIYALLARGFQKRVSTIVFGIGGDTVKSRIGCHSEQLYLFAKGRRPLLSLIIRTAGNFLIAQRPAVARFRIFKDDVSKNPNDRRLTRT